MMFIVMHYRFYKHLGASEAMSILYPDKGVRLSVCHGSDTTSHLGPYQSVTDVMSLPIWGPISACIVSATVT